MLFVKCVSIWKWIYKTPSKRTFDHLPISSCIGTSLPTYISFTKKCKLWHLCLRWSGHITSKYRCATRKWEWVFNATNIAEWRIIWSRERQKFLLVPFTTFYFIAWITGKNNNSNRKDFAHSHHSPVLTPISSPRFTPANSFHSTHILYRI